MPLLAAQLQNVYLSLDAYFTANLLYADGSAVALRLHGVRQFIPPPVLPWVETHYDFIGLEHLYKGRAGMGIGPARYATERRGYVQLNAYQRARTFSQRYTTAFIRDLIVDILPEGEVVPVYDYLGTLPDTAPEQQASIVLDGLNENVIDSGMQSGVIQHALRCDVRYVENFTRA